MACSLFVVGGAGSGQRFNGRIKWLIQGCISTIQRREEIPNGFFPTGMIQRIYLSLILLNPSKIKGAFQDVVLTLHFPGIKYVRTEETSRFRC
jgi:hypothetical protein